MSRNAMTAHIEQMETEFNDSLQSFVEVEITLMILKGHVVNVMLIPFEQQLLLLPYVQGHRNIMESVEKISPVSPSKARKRKRQPGKWKHNCAKKLRYASPGLPIYPKCGHATKSFRCAALSMKQCLDFCHLYYENKDCAYQNVFLLKYCEVVPVARRRPSTSSHKRKNGNIPQEKRGGDHCSFKLIEQRQKVIEFTSLPVSELHRCHSAQGRQYLPSEMNIAKLSRMYNDKSEDTLLFPLADFLDSVLKNLQKKQSSNKYVITRVLKTPTPATAAIATSSSDDIIQTEMFTTELSLQ
uniref:Uncharacterized protein n=1 Tax=Timema poppense TaxID=170557 RepID=A0A7R9DK01_TIMPO|nr:unnamed protein product [Timema poppensis]